MSWHKPPLEDLLNESDVEQKLLYPLLTIDAPYGLGMDHASIRTKHNVRRFTIGKGTETKSYLPDYIVTRGGYPLAVCEAKEPNGDVISAFREARLYAAELNAVYPAGFNPVTHIMATTGVRTLAGSSDDSEPHFDINYQDIDVYSDLFASLSKEWSSVSFDKRYNHLLPKIRPRRYWKPRNLVGGQAVRLGEVDQNTFGATISADFKSIFNPLALEDRANIAKHAYVPSKRRERYIEPIDRVIRAASLPSESRSKTIDDTASPFELIRAFRTSRKLEHQILLLLGSAGAGKTTFVDYLHEVALPRDVRSRTFWIRINMNPAPISRQEIYDWLRNEIIEICKRSESNVDFEELDVIKEVYSPEIKSFRKGIGRLHEKNEDRYNDELSKSLRAAQGDKHLTAVRLASYVGEQKGRLLVFVLDNCDKRLRDEQLLMFEGAQWLQREFNGLVVLPLREETYDNHRNEAPLDTALKDLVFRIEPPLFQYVLQKRVALALASLDKRGKKVLRFSLPNGMHVDYAASDQSFFLSSIMKSIFEHDRHVRRFIVGLSGRNIRRALEIFLEFCTSGHIPESEIVKIRRSEGNHVLSLEIVTTVLLRLNQRFYSSSSAYLKNLYEIDEHDERPHYFSRLLILRELMERHDTVGPKRLRGYESISVLRAVVAGYGVPRLTFDREIENLVKSYCILTEDFRLENLRDDDLVALSPAGHVHLQIIDNVYYLAAISEDTWYDNEDAALQVAQRIKDDANQYDPSTIFNNASHVVNALTRARELEMLAVNAVTSNSSFERLTSLGNAQSNIARFERDHSQDGWKAVREKYRQHSTHSGKISGVADFGVFVSLGEGINGLIHKSALPSSFRKTDRFRKGSSVDVVIVDIEPLKKRLTLALSVPQ